MRMNSGRKKRRVCKCKQHFYVSQLVENEFSIKSDNYRDFQASNIFFFLHCAMINMSTRCACVYSRLPFAGYHCRLILRVHCMHAFVRVFAQSIDSMGLRISCNVFVFHSFLTFSLFVSLLLTLKKN